MLATSASTVTSPVQFVDVGREEGLKTLSVWGDPNHKRYIIEAKGSGIAFFPFSIMTRMGQRNRSLRRTSNEIREIK